MDAMKSPTGSLVVLLILILLSTSNAADFFVAPNGSDSNPGTKDQPFASVGHAQEAIAAGDTVFIRGGTYVMQESNIASKRGIFAHVIELEKSGTLERPINYFAFENEKPVFDFSHVKPEGFRVSAFFVGGDWIHIKGIEVVGVQVTIKTHTQSICFENNGSNNIFEMLSMHDGQAIGYYSTRGANNLVLNCDAYRNYDYTSEGGKGGNVDGFGCHPRKGDTGNVFRGCRAWFNSDDGYDCINAHESVTFENCWAFYNGYSPKFDRLADGNGFKAGGYGATPVSRLPDPIPRHTVRYCVAVRNKSNGFYANHHIGGDDFLNNTAYHNGADFNMLSRQSDNKTDVPGYGHKLRNNLAPGGKTAIKNIDFAKCDSANNSFDIPIQIDDSDFASVDQEQLTLPRQADGSLPQINFLHPANAHIPPDLGAFATKKQ
jgi:hypothetical protein